MKLEKNDKIFLKKIGYLEEDFNQIERAAGGTIYRIFSEDKEEKISKEKSIELLGRKNFLSSLARSAFHCSAVCQNVYFDSKKFFK